MAIAFFFSDGKQVLTVRLGLSGESERVQKYEEKSADFHGQIVHPKKGNGPRISGAILGPGCSTLSNSRIGQLAPEVQLFSGKILSMSYANVNIFTGGIGSRFSTISMRVVVNG